MAEQPTVPATDERQSPDVTPALDPLRQVSASGLWHCGNGHYHSERLLRIIENSRTAWTAEAIGELDGHIHTAGPELALLALEPTVPF